MGAGSGTMCSAPLWKANTTTTNCENSSRSARESPSAGVWKRLLESGEGGLQKARNCGISEPGEARDLAGKKAGFKSGGSYGRAKRAIEQAIPGVIEALDRGDVSIAAVRAVAAASGVFGSLGIQSREARFAGDVSYTLLGHTVPGFRNARKKGLVLRVGCMGGEIPAFLCSQMIFGRLLHYSFPSPAY